MAARPLPLQACLGFGGTVGQGLILHPDNKTLIYPLGTTIVLRDKGDLTRQEFLQGHDNRVSCVTMSPTGKFLASGQVAPMGFSSPIIIWDYARRKLIHRLTLHKVKIQGLDFSFDEELLTSYGGTDDCKLVIWRTKTGEAICGSPTPLDFAIHAKWGHNSRNLLATTADMKIVVWRVEVENRKLYPSYCDTGKRKRCNQCVVIDDKDEFMYVGTRTGDVMQVSVGPKLYRASGPKPFIEMGVLCLQFTPFKDLVAGGGDGTVNLLRLPSFKNAKRVKLDGAVTSLAVCPGKGAKGSFEVYAGTSMAQIYLVKYDGLKNAMAATLIQRSHFNRINDIAFPANYSDLFCTASSNDIRLWTLKDMKEILRIQVANQECELKDSLNQECLCCAFMPDGKTIISGWSDGRIRAYAPQTGKLQYTIVNAHQKMGAFVGSDNTKCFQGVLSLAPTTDSLRIVSGGCRGDVRVWRIGSQSHTLLATMTAHVQGCNYISVKKDNSECVTCSNDGSCMIWDLTRYSRVNSMGANNFFKSVVYHPDESQILSCGTDRKITFWDAFDCQPIRVIEGSLSAEMLALDVAQDGEGFVSGGGDREVKLWNYDEGHCYFVGLGHSACITRLKISPDMKKIVSVGEDGAILIWDYRKPISDSPPGPNKNVTVKSPGSPSEPRNIPQHPSTHAAAPDSAEAGAGRCISCTTRT